MFGRRIFWLVLFFFLGGGVAFSGQWARTYGGDNGDLAVSIWQTSDGGSILAGETSSYGAGSIDLWVLKLDSDGNVTWQKTYGGDREDWGNKICQTSDGGYVVVGGTQSFGAGNGDVWVLKLDSQGNVVWQKTYGGNDWDNAFYVQQSADGGYVVAGETYSFGAGNGDVWVLKLDSQGNVVWQKTYGGDKEDWAYSIRQTNDGGYLVVGGTYSFGAGNGDIWILKLDSQGNVVWQKTYGGTMADVAYSVHQTTDTGYILVGAAGSFGAGNGDVWVLKLDSQGNVIWQKTYGGSAVDWPTSILQTTDGSYVVAGETYSFGAGNGDVWVLKLDSQGNVVWQKTYGGDKEDWAYSIRQSIDGGYVVAGGTYSFGAGNGDVWVLKLDGNGDIPGCSLGESSQVAVADTDASGTDTTVTGQQSNGMVQESSASVNTPSITGEQQCQYSPNNEVTTGQWAKSYGGGNLDIAYSVKQTSDGGFILVGNSMSFGANPYLYDIWVVKLDANGDLEWQKAIGGEKMDKAFSIQQTSDGGYVIGGYTESFGAGSYDLWIIKLRSNGDIEWQKTYGGQDCECMDEGDSIQQTADGGYVVAGTTCSFGDEYGDFWVLKLNAQGDIEWQKAYNGGYVDRASVIRQTSDGGYILAGKGEFWDQGGYKYDLWVLKLNAQGDIEWQKIFGMPGADAKEISVQQAALGGYIVVGNVEYNGTGNRDFLVLKLSASGDIEWQKVSGDEGHDESGDAVIETTDGGYVVAGSLVSSSPMAGGSTLLLLMKLDSRGNVVWQKTYGEREEFANALQQTSDGGYVVAGYTSSGAGNGDFWVLRLDADGDIPGCPLEGYANVPVSDTTVTVMDTNASAQDTHAVVQSSSAVAISTNGTTNSQCQYGGISITHQVNATTFTGGDYQTNHLELAFVRPQELSQTVDLYISLTQPAAEGGTVTYYFRYSGNRVTLPNGIYFNSASPLTAKTPYCTACTMPDVLQLYGPDSMNPIFNDGWVVPHPFTMADGVESCQYLPDGNYTFTVEAYESGTDNLLARDEVTITLNRGCE